MVNGSTNMASEVFLLSLEKGKVIVGQDNQNKPVLEVTGTELAFPGGQKGKDKIFQGREQMFSSSHLSWLT